MKVLYVKTQIGVGGLERIVVNKMNYLTRHEGYEIAYAYFGNDSKKTVYELDNRIKSYPMNVKATGGLMVKIKSVYRTYKALNRIINEFKPDVIENADTVVATWLLPFMKRHIPKILETHQSYEGVSINDMHIYKGNLFKIKVNNWLRRKVYPLYDCFVVLTDADKKAWGFKNMEVIGNFSYLKPASQNIMGGGVKIIHKLLYRQVV